MIRTVTLRQPPHLAFGRFCSAGCAPLLKRRGLRRALIVTAPQTRRLAEPIVDSIRAAGLEAFLYDFIDREPTVAMFHAALDSARSAHPDAVIGIGGGSPLDAAKLIAAFLNSSQPIEEAFGIDLLAGRDVFLACLPTTAGTGSEVSPNAILLDESDNLKKGVISPHLVPDAAFIDPTLTVTMPPEVTAGTGLDALTHCIEAFTNKFAHPAVDLYALEGIRRIAAHLPRAVADGSDLDARENVALGSIYGGLCLGPVNTAAVHALSYPLGGEFHVAHGISNAVLLPHVMEFNIPSAPDRYAEVARALGASTAAEGVRRVRELIAQCNAPATLTALHIPSAAIPRLADSALKVQRLLKNNPRELTHADAISIYEQAL